MEQETLLQQSIQIRNKREDSYKSLEINPPLLQCGFISARINKVLSKDGLCFTPPLKHLTCPQMNATVSQTCRCPGYSFYHISMTPSAGCPSPILLLAAVSLGHFTAVSRVPRGRCNKG